MLGAAEGHDHNLISFMPNHTSTWSRETGPRSLERAGLTNDDIDHTMIYDSFTYTTLVTLEGLGFAALARGPILSPTSEPRPAANSRSTPTAAVCPTRTRGCTEASCWWRRCASCAVNVANARVYRRALLINRRRPAWSTAPVARFRRPARWCWQPARLPKSGTAHPVSIAP